MSRRVFVPHRAGDTILVSERLRGDDGLVAYSVALQMDPQSGAIVADYSGDLSERDVSQCRDLVAQMQRYEQAVARTGACNFVALSDPKNYPPDATSPALQRLWAEYAAQALIYGQVAEDYLAQPPEPRISPELSLDLYRKALSFHDLARGRRFLQEDIPILKKRGLSRHHRECLYDALFHLARRAGLREMAYTSMQWAWQACPNPERTAILFADAAYFKISDDVVRYATHLRKTKALSPLQLAQLAVAHARRGERKLAIQTRDALKALGSEEAERMAGKIGAFLAAGPHD